MLGVAAQAPAYKNSQTVDGRHCGCMNPKWHRCYAVPVAIVFLAAPRCTGDALATCFPPQEAMDLKGDDAEMKHFLQSKFGECHSLVKLIAATPPHQIHRRRIEVGTPFFLYLTLLPCV